ncbi:F-box protein SKIP28 [Gastrolobium bilobum]|uniref:F-box protein SKIP28 n=1 Tax=Gastrolobium bilobum TaxID=150636 RepID=UPI002AB30D54|nr:F-box protein SKIP28 [Gastrolobium bilobum]
MEESSKASTSSLSFIVEQVQAEPEPPHEAVFLVLAYLPVYELLVMSQVCTSLRDAVNDDVLPWLNVIVERPLNSRLSDEILMKITSKANGRLKTLALMNCIHITDEGLQRVVEQNPLINKLHIPACTSLTPEGVLCSVKTLCQMSNCLSTLSLNGIYNLQKEHLDMLALNLRKNLHLGEQQPQQPIYYHERGSISLFKQEESHRIIDLEICPKCFEVRMVYDCPKGMCKMREWPLAHCRGCIFCIPRCENCGECIGSEEAEEGACGDILCLECWLKLPKCSFCNKPYCKQHTSWWCTSSDSLFLCKVCDENSHGYTYTDVL